MSFFFSGDEMRLDVVEEGKCSRKIKAYGGDLMCVEVYYEKGGIGPIHEHPHEQITYCLSGEFEFTIGSEICLIKQGDSVYMPPNISHGCILKSDSGRLLDVFTPIREDFLKE